MSPGGETRLDELRLGARYALGLPRFFHRPLTTEQSRALVAREREEAPRTFLDTLRRAVFENPRSPYLPLLRAAGAAYGDLERLVADDGVETCLARLFDAGVHIALAEFKGRAPIVRPGLEIHVSPHDFDNPLLSAGFAGSTGGTGGAARRLSVDLAGLSQEGAYYRLMLASYGLLERRAALWRPVPPGVTGITGLLRAVKAGAPAERWFTPSRFARGADGLRGRATVAAAVAAGRLTGTPVPWPEHVPVDAPLPVTRWLAGALETGPPAILHATSSSAIRVCDDATAAGISIAGTFFRLGGEPFTAARRDRIAAAGCRAAAPYSMSEVGNVAMPCADSEHHDAVHLLEGKLGLYCHPREHAVGTAGALYLSSLSSLTSKLMLNVETGDEAAVRRRRCRCEFGALGYTTELSHIRSYEKLTGEGMSFLAADLLPLLEEKLPARFGGRSTDYQLAERELDGRVTLELAVAPRVGAVREADVVAFVLAELGQRGSAERMMSDIWRHAQALHVVRREPFVTAAGKTPALRILPRG